MRRRLSAHWDHRRRDGRIVGLNRVCSPYEALDGQPYSHPWPARSPSEQVRSPFSPALGPAPTQPPFRSGGSHRRPLLEASLRPDSRIMAGLVVWSDSVASS
ncbi:MAG: hypothetical protein AAGM38_15185 [Pseudomonadota bacterium]